MSKHMWYNIQDEAGWRPALVDSQKTKKADGTLERVLKDFAASWEYTSSSWHSRWEDNYKLYNNQRIKRGYDGITDTFVPMTFSTIETKTSALFGTKPKFEYLPPQDRPEQNTEILNALLDYYWDKDQWSIKVIHWGRGFLQLGTSVIYLYWDGDCPRIINIPLRDFFIDPTATSLEDAHYMGRRYLVNKEDLKSFEIVDLDKVDENGDPTGEMKPRYKNLDKIKAGSTGDETDKQQKDMFYGATTKSTDQVEVIEYWTDDKIISVANRCVVIEETENWFKAKARANGDKFPKGLMPFSALRNYTDESLFYAKGEIDFIAEEQELLNDITNQNIDSITYTLNQMYTLDPKYAHLLNEVENLPGAVYLAEANALQPINQRPIPGDAFNERMNIKNEIRETTASNEVVKGVSQDSNATATEVNAQIAGAGQRLGLQITQIEDEGFHRLAKIVLEMVKLYVNETMMVRIVGKDGTKWEEFDPTEFKGDYEPRVQLDVSVENQKQQDANIAKEMLAAFLGDPEINQTELKKLVLQRAFDLDPDEVKSLTELPEAEMMAPEMGMMGEPIDPMAGAPEDLAPEMMAPPTEEELAMLAAEGVV